MECTFLSSGDKKDIVIEYSKLTGKMAWVEHYLVIHFGEVGILKQNIEYLAYLEPGLSLDGGLRNLGTENHDYLELIKHLENEGSVHIYDVGDFGEIDEDDVQNNDDGPNIGEIEVVGPDRVENNEDGPVLGETEAVGLVGVENNEYGHFMGETEAAGLVGVENNDDGLVLGETEAARHVMGESEGVGPVLGERGDGDNEGSEKVGRSVNADSNDITTATAESDEDDDSESEDLTAEGWLTDEDDEEISQIFNNKRKFKSRNFGDEHQEAQPKRTATDSQRKESSVEDESSDTDYIESNDPGSYETDSEVELCVKKGKKLFFDDKAEVPRIELGMIFENSKQFKEALGVYAVAKRFDFRFVGKHFLSKLKILPNLKLKDMMRLAKDELKVELNKNMCQRARFWANQKIRGRLEDEFNKLFDYVYTLREADPNGTFDLFVQRPTPSANPIFKRLYVCFGDLMEGFKKHCRPVLSLDGCYLKGDFKGEILAAVGRDGNNQIFPVAWVVVEVENRETWAWFLEHIQIDLEIGDGDRFTILSDMQKGLLEEMQLILPNVEHRFCARHMYANWKKENSGHDMQQLFWACCKATTEAEFHKHSARMATLKDTALSSLLKRDPKHWSKAFFRTHSKCDAVDNNFGEAFNLAIISARGSFLEDQKKREKERKEKQPMDLSCLNEEASAHVDVVGMLGHNTRTCPSKNNVSQQTQNSTSLQPAATDVSQPPAPNPSQPATTDVSQPPAHNPSQPATTDVSQPPAHNPSQPATSQASQPQFPNSRNTSTKTKGKTSCGRQSTKPLLGPRGRKIMEGIGLYTNEKTGMQILNPGRPSQMLVRRPNTRSHATLSEPLIPSQPTPLGQQFESIHPAPVYQHAVMSTAPSTSTNHGNIIHKLLPRRRSS
ncbi:hypothetical protein GQ457_12G008350 [Hibiscus cannabinus]